MLFLSDNGAAPDGGLIPTDRMLGFSPGVATNSTWRRDGVPIRPGSGPLNPPGPHETFSAYGLAWALTSNTPFRATKLTGYEGGIRTPLIPFASRQYLVRVMAPDSVMALLASAPDRQLANEARLVQAVRLAVAGQWTRASAAHLQKIRSRGVLHARNRL